MKRNTFTTVFLSAMLYSAVAIAQTIPGSAFPVAGDVYSLTQADTTGVEPGAGGQGMTWNFASLTNSSGAQVDSFMSPGATPYGGVFPTATVAVHETAPPTTNYYIYYYNNTGSSVYQRIGNVQPDTVIYSTPSNEYNYPLSWGTTFGGSYYARYHSPGGPTTESGAISGGVDGTGTLTLPTGTYGNVLRAHYTRSEHDTAGPYAIVGTFDYYEWYQPNAYYPIFSIATTVISSAVINENIKTVGYRAGYASSGISQVSEKNGLMVYPNPAMDKATVLYAMDQPGECTISIYDLTGRLLHMQTEGTGEGMQAAELSLSQLPAGIYEIRVVNPESATSLKLQVTR